jgi:hypothetical protein
VHPRVVLVTCACLLAAVPSACGSSGARAASQAATTTTNNRATTTAPTGGSTASSKDWLELRPSAYNGPGSCARRHTPLKGTDVALGLHSLDPPDTCFHVGRRITLLSGRFLTGAKVTHGSDG